GGRCLLHRRSHQRANRVAWCRAGRGDAMSEIRRAGVVGFGVMGAGFAELCSRAGLDTIVVAPNRDAVSRGRQRLLRSFDNGVRKGKITEAEREGALARLSFAVDLGELGDRQFVLETVPEQEPTKLQVFEALDKVVEDRDAILASSTSSIPI